MVRFLSRYRMTPSIPKWSWKTHSFNPDIDKYERQNRPKIFLEEFKNGRKIIKQIAIGYLLASIIVAGSCVAFIYGRSHNSFTRIQGLVFQSFNGHISQTNCKEIRANYCNLTEKSIQEKVNQIKHWYYEAETITATITAYSKEEFGGNNARGFKGVVGESVACPRRIPFGSYVKSTEFGTRTCDDHLATRFDERFDLFVNTTANALSRGKRQEEVTILYSKPIWK